jgi:DNA-directed RNA polymerase specialized sigma24 family protein
MTPKYPSRGLRAQIDREISQLDRERARLEAARAELERDLPRRLSQDDVAAFLTEHPGSTYTEIADGLGAPAKNVAMHLNRGKAASRFRNAGGKWSLGES